MAIPKLKKQNIIDALKFIDENGVPEHSKCERRNSNQPCQVLPARCSRNGLLHYRLKTKRIFLFE